MLASSIEGRNLIVVPPNVALTITFEVRVSLCAALNPPQLLLSIGVGFPPGAPNANVTDAPAPRPEVESHDWRR
ncbi:MAG TPA: hypothetical protein VGV15_01805 [Terriglobales bacterium]|nr:hypothetical protein [Terriglobales bacterium]